MHKDCDGQVLEVGNRVAVQRLYYKELRPMWVHSFTPKCIRVVERREQLTWGKEHGRVVEPQRVALLRYQQEDD